MTTKSVAQAGGYLPSGCTLPDMIVAVLMMENTDPCAGCNADRSECKGREKYSRPPKLSEVKRR